MVRRPVGYERYSSKEALVQLTRSQTLQVAGVTSFLGTGLGRIRTARPMDTEVLATVQWVRGGGKAFTGRRNPNYHEPGEGG